MECDPAESVAVENVALAVASSVPEPSEVLPSRKLTVPVGVAVAPVGPATLAVNVTDWLGAEGLGEEASAVVVDKRTGGFTTWVNTADVEPLKFESPPYTAV